MSRLANGAAGPRYTTASARIQATTNDRTDLEDLQHGPSLPLIPGQGGRAHAWNLASVTLRSRHQPIAEVSRGPVRGPSRQRKCVQWVFSQLRTVAFVQVARSERCAGLLLIRWFRVRVPDALLALIFHRG
jgi:hypothetical protein